jgi:acetyl esterase/lipase
MCRPGRFQDDPGMPIGYAFSVALLAFCTATAVIGVRPPRTTPSHWSYWATFVINELPFLALYLLIADSALAGAQGDLVTPVGLVALAVAVVTAVGLGVLVRRAMATGPQLRRVLAGAGIALPLSPRPWAPILLAPLRRRRRDVVRVADISYGDAGRRNRLDVYHRRDRPGGAGILVYFHGGGFRIGHKRKQAKPLLNELAAQGWVCISANYRLEPAHRFPAAHVDAKRVVAWARAHAAEFGGDPRTIIVSGSSAGGHLASMIALTPNDPAFQPGFESVDTSVAAVIAFGGYFGRVAGPGSSPLDRLGEAPPFLFLHGVDDSSVLVEDAREFAAGLRAVSGSPVVLGELPGGQHAYDLFRSVRYSYVIDAVAAFGSWVGRRTTPGR